MIHIIIGTKAQLIKMAPIMRELEKRGAAYRFVFTGQHKDTVKDLIDNFKIKSPDIILYKRKDVDSVLGVFFWFLIMIYLALFKKKIIFGDDGSHKDYVLVHGDTLSTLIGALMGRFAGMRVCHIESGLRSFNFLNPFPEELTRVATFRMSHVFFCPDEKAEANLLKYNGEKINTNGNTLRDALFYAKSVAIPRGQKKDRPFVVVSLHRYENICSQKALDRNIRMVEIAASSLHVVFVAHKPTMRSLENFGLIDKLKSNQNIRITPRMDYFSFIGLVGLSEFVISDGGSNQEECSYLGKPLLLLRKTTERFEGLQKNCLLSSYEEKTVRSFCENYREYEYPEEQESASPSSRVCDYLLNI